MDDGYLSSHAEWQGRFWLPGRESEVQRGILSYEPDRGLRLSLIGGFDHAEWLPGPTPGTGVMSDRNTTWPVIHGSVGSAKVTLFDCIVQRSSFQMTVATVSRDAIKAEQQLMRVELMLLGALLKDKEQAVFQGIDIEIENLTAWHCAPDVRYSIDNPENPAQRRKWRIEVEPVDSVSVDVDQMSVQLSRSYREELSIPVDRLVSGDLRSS